MLAAGALLLGALLATAACDTTPPPTDVPFSPLAGLPSAFVPGRLLPTEAVPVPPGDTSAGTPRPATPTRAPLPRATPIPVALTVVDTHTYTTPMGLAVIGRLRNQGATAVFRLRVVVRADDQAGDTIGAGSDTLLANVVLPAGTDAPFKATLAGVTAAPEHLVFQQAGQGYVPDRQGGLVPSTQLATAGTKLAPVQKGQPRLLTGRVVNGGPAQASNVQVLALAYDAQDHLVDVAGGPALLPDIPAQGTAPFTLSFPYNAERIARTTFVLFGLTAPP